MHINKPVTGIGEYWIKNYTLLQSEYICPFGFDFIIRGFCLRLISTEIDLIGNITKEAFFDSFEYNKSSLTMGKCITHLDTEGSYAVYIIRNKHIIAGILSRRIGLLYSGI